MAERARLRLGSALVLWGVLALAGWLAVLVPAYLLFDRGPALVQSLFDDEGRPLPFGTMVPDSGEMLLPTRERAKDGIVPAAGGLADDMESPRRPARSVH